MSLAWVRVGSFTGWNARKARTAWPALPFQEPDIAGRLKNSVSSGSQKNRERSLRCPFWYRRLKL